MLNWLLANTGGLILPESGADTAPIVDFVFMFIFWVSVFFFALITVLMVYFVVRYRRRPGRENPDPSPSHSTGLEVTWTLIPIVIVGFIFYWGFEGFVEMTTRRDRAYPITVESWKWNFEFVYENGHRDPRLHVPAGVPVELTLTSQDVIHSLYIPAFRLKRDLVPGRYNKTSFTAHKRNPGSTEPEVYDLLCAEYCGDGHSEMITQVVVHDPDAFRRWLSDAANFLDKMSPKEAGAKLYVTKGCNKCHSVDGTGRTGPTFKDVFGADHLLVDGSTVRVDEDYIRESIIEPNAKIVAGYGDVRMPTYQGRIKDREIDAIIAYLQSISANYTPPADVLDDATGQDNNDASGNDANGQDQPSNPAPPPGDA